MFYTVGEIAKILNVAPSTLRYYDREGILPFVGRSGGGIRVFKDEDFEWLYIIDCLKKAGMPLKDIRTFVDLVNQGDGTIEQRLEMFQERQEVVEEQIAQMQETLDLLKYKCWYYETAKAAGTCAVHDTISLEEIPEELRYIKEKTQNMNNLG